MSATDALAFPIKGRAYRHQFTLRDNVGANMGAWTTPTCDVWADGVAQSALTPVQIGTSQWGYVDIPDSYTDVTSILITVSVANADALPYDEVILFHDLDLGTTGASPTSTDQSSITLSQMWAQLHAAKFYAHTDNGTILSYLKSDSVTAWANCTITDDVTIGKAT